MAISSAGRVVFAEESKSASLLNANPKISWRCLPDIVVSVVKGTPVFDNLYVSDGHKKRFKPLQ
jgi:hypothetical protein